MTTNTTLREALEAICDMQARHYGDGMATHLALIDLTKQARAALALTQHDDDGAGSEREQFEGSNGSAWELWQAAWQARGQQAGDALDGIAIGYEHGAGMKNPYTMGGLVTLSYDTPEQAVAAMAIIRAAIVAARASSAKGGE